MIDGYEQYLVAKRQRTELVAALQTALAEPERDDFAEAHIAHLRSDAEVLLQRLQGFAKSQRSEQKLQAKPPRTGKPKRSGKPKVGTRRSA